MSLVHPEIAHGLIHIQHIYLQKENSLWIKVVFIKFEIFTYNAQPIYSLYDRISWISRQPLGYFRVRHCNVSFDFAGLNKLHMFDLNWLYDFKEAFCIQHETLISVTK